MKCAVRSAQVFVLPAPPAKAPSVHNNQWMMCHLGWMVFYVGGVTVVVVD